MAPPLPLADASDIVRASTKDEEYITLLEAAIRELLLCTLPNSTTSSPTTARLVSTTARLLYFLSPLRRSLPTTPGEEYAAVLPIRTTPHTTALPTRRALLLRALAQLAVPSDLVSGVRFAWRSAISGHVPFPAEAVSALLDVVRRLHTALFYFRGAFQAPACRAACLRYARVSLRAGTASAGWLRLLGAIAVLQVVVDISRALRRAVARARRVGGHAHLACYPPSKEFLTKVIRCWVYPRETGEDENEEDEAVGRAKCILCLSGMKDPTLTGCGHVFCWRCICSWCSSNEICPLCRQVVVMKKLVCLYNY